MPRWCRGLHLPQHQPEFPERSDVITSAVLILVRDVQALLNEECVGLLHQLVERGRVEIASPDVEMNLLKSLPHGFIRGFSILDVPARPLRAPPLEVTKPATVSATT